MPPVFGPVSLSPTRLKSCAGSSGSTADPSVTQNSETSGPARNSSITTVPQASAWSSAAARSVVTSTPLPAASPSSFTTYGGPNRSSAAAASPGVEQVRHAAVGTPAAAITSLANAFEPSIRAAAALGPKQAIPTARTASAAPATSGTSGPITTRSARTPRDSAATAAGSPAASGRCSATVPVPALPGAQTSEVTAGSAASPRHSACSRAPLPTTRTRTGARVPARRKTDGRRRPAPPVPREWTRRGSSPWRWSPTGRRAAECRPAPSRGPAVPASSSDCLPLSRSGALRHIGARLLPVAGGDRPDQQVGDEADGQDGDHRVERRPIGVDGQLARRALGVQEAVDDQRPGDAGGRPRGEQPAVDRADLERAEQVTQVGRDGREPTAVERDDQHGEQHEQPGGVVPDRGQSEVGQDADAEVDHVHRLAADVVRRQIGR